ncbi:protein-export membrane protein SecD [Candidatus Nomurabacteria bacterium RIFCSPHIGHO2_02_FULL_33_12]|uniref:Protein translocase subunit SecD n=1 Tax=Candidatus Nomurabacteria bacterium RIFCSPLOWO2_01_FULL_33_17 TaxID=1801764 RepID=A0A1F6WQK5_9BACT|nr:MAG: protein-export membrane protein SecD [Candidatus Nomurabacteria bacterium RIFCSPHIGHO2_02_FULL_33_12]OGI84153.1 MAG: protein-export membrane protein SecD [Candidatus Nomurabacteria bacterium RIFCSPLOWO2_01_FULL_33_17]
MWKRRIVAFLILVVAVGIGYFVYTSEPKISGQTHTGFLNKPFRLGLDLSGGTQLVYRADVSKIEPQDVGTQMGSLRQVIENRILDSKKFKGVSEAVVRTQAANFSNGNEERLTIELPGITDIAEAVSVIGQTTTLEFKVERNKDEAIPVTIGEDGNVNLGAIEQYVSSGLDGSYLKRADATFDQTTGLPTVSITWNDEGSKLFAEITKANVGKTIAIYLDGAIISAPNVNEEITGGQAVISGSFNIKEAKELKDKLNFGRLPVPIELVSTSNIGATLGAVATDAGVKAGVIGFIAIALFMILWYRLPGVIAVLNLAIYVAIMLAIFKLWPVTLTAAGIAGFIISLGIAVDANILVFERMKEEVAHGGTIRDGLTAGFSRAWTSVRDSNVSSLITAFILYATGTALIKSFAFTFFMGTLISLIVAYSVSRRFFGSISLGREGKLAQFLFGSGFKNAKIVIKS